MSEMLEDPRPDFLAAVAWFDGLVRGVQAGQFGELTPCAGWTVQDLLGHCLRAAGRVAALAQHTDPAEVAQPVPDDAWAGLFGQAEADIRRGVADQSVLARSVTLPFGEMLFGDFLRMFTGEFMIHGWDLATATGQEAEGPADVAERALARSKQTIPAEPRNPQAFGPVVEVGPDAGPTRRLAAWLGR
jgi:uncharacterized protein (TIGR03086 family)